ncbi:glycosyltransferase [Candidatus Omnitrophota bacterium]
MKVIFITREGYEQPGARIRCYGFAEQLQKRGIAAEVFSFVDTLGAKAGKDEKNFSTGRKLKLIFKSIKRLSDKKRCVFVINRFNYHTLPSWLCSFFLRNPVIFDMDDWEAREDLGYYLGFIPKSKAEFLTRIFSRCSRFCIASSNYLEDYLSQFNKKVYYVPTGVDLDIFKPSVSRRTNGKVIFSWHGLINRRETLDDLKFMMDCFKIVNRRYRFTELWIKGSGMFIEDFLNIRKKINNEKIKYISWSSPQSIPSYLDKVDIGLFPVLKESRFNRAKSPTKIFEYMAVKVPVIASKIGEADHLISQGDSGFLASGRDEFISHMEKVITQPDVRKRVADNAYRRVKEDYSLEVLGKRLCSTFLENL